MPGRVHQRFVWLVGASLLATAALTRAACVRVVASHGFSTPALARRRHVRLGVGWAGAAGAGRRAGSAAGAALMAAPPIDESRIAVILNTNARRVGAREVATARELVGHENVFVTGSEEDASAACAAIVARGYGTVVPAGGDGTLCAVINGLVRERRERWGEAYPLLGMPRLAYLPLGTGNGMGMLVGPRAPMADALRALCAACAAGAQGASSSGGGAVRTLSVPMIEIDGKELCFFAGCGFDSLMLNDFKAIRNWARTIPGSRARHIRLGPLRLPNPIRVLAEALQSLAGYFVAYFVRTLPQCLAGRHHVWATVTAPAHPAPPAAAKQPAQPARATEAAVAAEGQAPAHAQRPSSPPPLPFGTWLMDHRRADTAMRVTAAMLNPAGDVDPAAVPNPQVGVGEAARDMGTSACGSTDLEAAALEPGAASAAPGASAGADMGVGAAAAAAAGAAVGGERLVLFEGKAGIIAAGTSPYYGGGLKLFPFARATEHGMHLRIGRISPLLGFLNLWWIFRGTYRNYHDGVLDYVGTDFTVELQSGSYPFQHSGEAVGEKASFTLKVAHAPVRFIDFLKPPAVQDRLPMPAAMAARRDAVARRTAREAGKGVSGEGAGVGGCERGGHYEAELGAGPAAQVPVRLAPASTFE